MNSTIGIDAGSAAVKLVALQGDRPVARVQEHTSADVASQCRRLLEALHASVQVAGAEAQCICATGYGRDLVPGADVRVSEILAGALGAGWMWRNWTCLGGIFDSPPEPPAVGEPFRTVIDVGGQDSKVITFTPDGLVDQFAMNDRCAAGTGRFLEVMARVLGTDLHHMDELALSSAAPCRMSSTCTVFAESEAISLLSGGEPTGNVAAGLYQGVSDRLAGLARQIGWSAPVMLAGGAARSRALRRALAGSLGCEVAVPACPEFTTALGAALFGAEERCEES